MNQQQKTHIGVVARYERSKGYGFLQTIHGDVFVHATSFSAAGLAEPEDGGGGECYTFTTKSDPRTGRRQATDLHLAEAKPADPAVTRAQELDASWTQHQNDMAERDRRKAADGAGKQ
jgi:cold shock CspA family protein